MTQVVILSLLEELAPSSLLASSLLSSEADGDGEKDAVKPPMTAYHHAIRLTQVFI